jgi:dTDP-4-amino-4,6-dideoxygalactose transaminase
MKIPFNQPAITGNEEKYLKEAIAAKSLSGDREFTKKCHHWLETKFGSKKALLTTSCTHAMEMGSLLAGIWPGDEVIMPSFTFVSTANPFVLRGAKIVFVDIRPDTMNMDEKLIEAVVTDKTKAVVPIHYAGIACEMDSILKTASKHNLLVIEDAAHAMMAGYKSRYLGTIGHMGMYSFHDTKNYTCGEGGAIMINDESFSEPAEIFREKGTDRSRFLRGEIDKYTWVSMGSSYLPSELNAAFLWAQLEKAEEINIRRTKSWNLYYEKLKPLMEKKIVELPVVPEGCDHNGHIFYLKVWDAETRSRLMGHLHDNGVSSAFHFLPLHTSSAGKTFGRFQGEDKWTTRESERLLRLPMYYDLTDSQIEYVCDQIQHFF